MKTNVNGISSDTVNNKADTVRSVGMILLPNFPQLLWRQRSYYKTFSFKTLWYEAEEK